MSNATSKDENQPAKPTLAEEFAEIIHRATQPNAGKPPPRLVVSENQRKPTQGENHPRTSTAIATHQTPKTHLKVHRDSSVRSHGSAKSRKESLQDVLQMKSELFRLADEEEAIKMDLARREAEHRLDQIQREREYVELIKESLEAIDDDDDSQKLSSDESEAEDEPSAPSKATVKRSVGTTPEEHFYQTPSRSQFEQFSQQLANAIITATKANQPKSKGPDDMKVLLARHSGAKDLPFFSGNYKEWPTFIATFRRTTAACKYTNDENIARLNKCLKGAALDAVQGLFVSPDNVDQIVKVLERRFGQPAQVIEAMIEELRSFPAVKDDRPDRLQELCSNVEGFVATVKSLRKEHHVKNPILLKDCTTKLPFHLSLRWGEKAAELAETGYEPDLTDFCKWLTRVSEALASANIVRFKQEQRTEHSHHQQQRYNGQSFKPKNFYKKPETVMVTTPSSFKRKSCVICQNNHTLEECQDYKKKNEDERWKLIKENHLCFCCLKKGHSSKECKSRKSCGIDGCNRPHHNSLHSFNSHKTEAPEAAHVHLSYVRPTPQVMLKVLPVKLIGPSCAIDAYALLDDAATVTLIDQDTADTLGLEGPPVALQITSTRSTSYSDGQSRRVQLSIQPKYSNETYAIHHARTVQDLALPSQTVSMKKLKQKWSHLVNIQLEDYYDAKPKILIGADNSSLLLPQEYIEGPRHGPIASKTKLGWVIHGNNKEITSLVQPEVVCLSVEDEKDDLHQLVEQFFSLENIGVKLCADKVKSKETQRAEEILNSTTTKVNGRFSTGLLWKEDNTRLPETRSTALRRLQHVEKKMDADPKYAEVYCEKINDYISKGYARKLTPEETADLDPKVGFLPHFGVVNPNKPTKLRIVFDAAAKSYGKSLNDHLLIGPDFLNPLPSVLFKFRQHQVAICADIKEMFPQIKINPEDSKAQRFLWRGRDRSSPPSTFEMTSMIFGAASSPCSAQFVKNRNALDHQHEYPEATEAIIRHHYMDDLADSRPSEQEAIKLAQEIIHVHKQGGFEICNWISNSKSFMESIPDNLRAKNYSHFLTECNEETERILGIHWNPEQDNFVFKFALHKVPADLLSQERIPTKREVLKLVMSLFDPLGLLMHFTVKAKILLQEVWKSHTDWDQEIHVKLQPKWKKWLLELEQVKNFKIPRPYFKSIHSFEDLQLHVFCDASQEALAAAAYVRGQQGRHVEVSLIMAKSKVAPTKVKQIPRLELIAAVIASRLAVFVRNEHKFNFKSVTLWSDSMIFLHWMRSETRQFTTFVANRIGEIEENFSAANWRWIPTKENVADDATRSSLPSDFSPKNRWISGPSFLYSNESTWPSENKNEKPAINHEELEIKKEFCHLTVIANNFPLPDETRFSSWLKLINATVWTIRTIQKFLQKIHTTSTILTSPEFQAAQQLWWKKIQLEHYPDEVTILKKVNSLPEEEKSRIKIPVTSPLFKVKPFMDTDGIIRINTRLSKSPDLDQATKFPVVLKSKCKYTELLIQWYHEKFYHFGHETIINELRQQYWIPALRSTVRQIIHNCQFCKVKKAQPLAPEMGSLPSFRITRYQRPFTMTGLDYFGPIEIKIGRRREKRYGALFTCLSTRAVHLELAGSLSTDSAIMAINRFSARRGDPECIFSDNGSNFRGAATELREAISTLDHAKIKSGIRAKDVYWKFIPPSAPHMGGAWERLVKSVKVALKNTLKERVPSEETLHTLLCEAEFTINCRPLTHVSLDYDDEEALTPNHFLLGSSSGRNLPGVFNDADLDLRKQWRTAQRLADHFWHRWVREYLPSISNRTKWNRNDDRKIQPGDLVFIIDENLPRNTWPRGIVTAVHPGKDNIPRVADVKTATRIYSRPVRKLAVIDIKSPSVPSATAEGGEMLP